MEVPVLNAIRRIWYVSAQGHTVAQLRNPEGSATAHRQYEKYVNFDFNDLFIYEWNNL